MSQSRNVSSAELEDALDDLEALLENPEVGGAPS